MMVEFSKSEFLKRQDDKTESERNRWVYTPLRGVTVAVAGDSALP